jgi:hypothetical protein
MRSCSFKPACRRLHDTSRNRSLGADDLFWFHAEAHILLCKKIAMQLQFVSQPILQLVAAKALS